MIYLNKYKEKLLKDDNLVIKQLRDEESNDYINQNFTLTHGYYCASLLADIDSNPYDIDVIVNSKTDGLQKDFVFRPKTQVRAGSYIRYTNQSDISKTYILREIETDDNTPTALGFLCNREIKFKSTGETLPVHTNSTTYGSKGIQDQDKFYELDSKTKIYVQKNRLSDTLKIGYRIMFANKYVYKITEFDDLVFSGMYTIVAQRDELTSMDDLENNIAWNQEYEYIEDEYVHTINGNDKLIVGMTNVYSVEVDCEWSIDDQSLVKIIEQSSTEIQLKGVKRGWITLTAKSENGELTKDILVA